MTTAAGPSAEQELARVQEALAGRFPHRMIPDLERIRDLLDLMGSPQRAYPSIHITGTNGKTSTARMVDALLRAFGLRPGRYTSPHLESVTERICIDGQPLTPVEFARAYDDVAPYAAMVDARHAERVTFHELLTAMAFAAFADAPVDAAVVEVGMGGSWDATNLLHSAVAVVTPVGLDHVDVLGPTLADIAREKAGIVHDGATLVMAHQPAEAAEVLLARAADKAATAVREGVDFGVRSRRVALGGQVLSLQGLRRSYDDVFVPLHGQHQSGNAAVALAAVEAFLGAEGGLDEELVRAGFAAADSPGRLEVMRTAPTVLLDGAHNPDGAHALAAALDDAFSFTRLIGVIGVLEDKDAVTILEILEPVLTAVVATQSSSPRALPADDLAAIAMDVFGADRVDVAPGLADALEVAVALADEAGDPVGAGVLVTGSVVTVGEARALLRGGR